MQCGRCYSFIGLADIYIKLIVELVMLKFQIPTTIKFGSTRIQPAPTYSLTIPPLATSPALI